MKFILITGTSTGLGFESANIFIKSGYTVFGSVRSIEDAERVKGLLGEHYIPLIFDVCNMDEIEHEAEKVKSYLDGQLLSGIINNAGWTEMGPLLHTSMDSFKKMFDILVLGHLRVIQQFISLLYSDHGEITPGRILNISSVSGIEGYPLFGCYAACKHALEGLSKSLRKELERYKVKVIVIGPDNIKVDAWNDYTLEKIKKYEKTDYYPDLAATIGFINHTVTREAMDVAEYCIRLKEIFEEPYPLNRYEIRK